MKDKRKECFINIYYSFIAITLLFPRGLIELNSLLFAIYRIMTWTAIATIWMNFILQKILQKRSSIIYIKKDTIKIILYFLLSIFITYIVRSKVNSGLQQMFLYPSVSLFIIVNAKKHPKKLLKIFINILLLLFSCQLIFANFFNNQFHMTFLGHVQLISQVGVLAIFISCLYWLLFRQNKYRVFCLIIITLIILIITDASSAFLTFLILIFGYILYKFKLYSLLCFNSRVYIIVIFTLSASLLFLVSKGNLFEQVFGAIDFSGRKFIWRDALLKIKQHPFIGYGIDGILIETFWTEWTGGGFNYAHNQIVQSLLDGGFIILISFFAMISSYTYQINNIRDRKYKILMNSVLICILFVMIFDSTTLYCYMYIILSLMYSFPEIINLNNHNLEEQNDK